MPRTRTTPPVSPAPVGTFQSLLRREHAGKWLAWSEDEARIIAVGDSAGQVRAEAERAGHSRFIYDWAPQAEARQITGLS